ncbi:conserved hypothetical protein (plasmid) [Cupriavidus metallidurans CH34]|uniref:Beta-ketoacyl synthase-like N-terminal domain-containing protein n=2 Tax=Cupriavidus metallidurans TaxID=119219 RepID=Q1LF35_CUPMC|nr:conserved hypothetical protein [Cupriavidus metallidurans CH34]
MRRRPDIQPIRIWRRTGSQSSHAQGMTLEFEIRAWAACAPALQTHADWLAWSRAPWLPEGADLPALAAMAPMLRRRVNATGRAALHPAYEIAANDAGVMPAVFASRHGDSRRAFSMLSELAAGEPLSPTAFGLSVHNAIGAMFSIDRSAASNIQALSGGKDTVEAAIVEACSLLADGADEVLLVCYDTPLPEPYLTYADEPQCLYGWAWRVGLPRAGAPVWTLELADPAIEVTDKSGDGPVDGQGKPLLPHGLEVLHFVLSNDAGAGKSQLLHRTDHAIWKWGRHV